MIRINSAKVKADFSLLKKKLGEAKAFIVGDKIMKDISSQAATIISQRTGKGMDADGKKFKKYSKEYAETKKKAGKQINPPNLNLSGLMLNSLQGRAVSPRKGEVYFSQSQAANRAAYNDEERNFFDIRRANEINALSNRANELIGIAIKKSGL